MPQRAERRWYVIRGTQQYGPVTDKELRLLLRSGHLKKTDRISRDPLPDGPQPKDPEEGAVEIAPKGVPANVLRGTPATFGATRRPRWKAMAIGLQDQLRLVPAQVLQARTALSQFKAKILAPLQAIAIAAAKLPATARRFLIPARERLTDGGWRGALARAKLVILALPHRARQRLAAWNPTSNQLLILGGALLLLCGGCVIIAALILRGPPAPAPPPPVLWSFHTDKPILVTTIAPDGSIQIEGVAIAGTNQTKQILQRVESTLRGEGSDRAVPGTLRIDNDPAPEYIAFDIPPGAKFSMRFPLSALGTNGRLSADELLSAYGGFTFTFRYFLSGEERSLFEHIPRAAVEKEIAALRARMGL